MEAEVAQTYMFVNVRDLMSEFESVFGPILESVFGNSLWIWLRPFVAFSSPTRGVRRGPHSQIDVRPESHVDLGVRPGSHAILGGPRVGHCSAAAARGTISHRFGTRI